MLCRGSDSENDLVVEVVALAAICAHSCSSVGFEGRNSHQQHDATDDNEYLFLNMNFSAKNTRKDKAIPKKRT